MPRRIKSKRRSRRRNRGINYVSPVFRTYKKPQSTTVTLMKAGYLSSGVSATNGLLNNILWTDFNDAVQFAAVYKYFEISATRIRCSLPTVSATTDSFYNGTVAFFPINYLVEALPTAVPVTRAQVYDLPGSVFLQNGVNNQGSWFYPSIKQQFSTSDAFSSTLNRAAGVVVAYGDDLGISEVLCDFMIELTLRFYEREYVPGGSTFVDVERMKSRNVSSPAGLMSVTDNDIVIDKA